MLPPAYHLLMDLQELPDAQHSEASGAFFLAGAFSPPQRLYRPTCGQKQQPSW